MSTFYKCYICNEPIDWENGDEEKGNLWGCEKCGREFCEACFTEQCGVESFFDTLCADGDKEVLCPDCYKIQYPQNTMKDIVDDQKEQKAVDRFYGVDDL